MSFFIRGKNSKKRDPKQNANRKRKFQKVTSKQLKHAPPTKDDDITSSEDDDEVLPEQDAENYMSDDENETVQEKKLRLAKVYLKEIEAQERKKQDHEEEQQLEQDAHDKNIQQILFHDHLKHIGRFRSNVADQYKAPGEITVLKCKEHKNAITCTCISADDKYLYSGSKDGGLVKWSLETNKKLLSLPFVKQSEGCLQGHSATILCMAVSFDNKFLAIGDATTDIQIWNPDDFKHIKTLSGHKNFIYGLVFRRGTHMLYSCSADRSVKIWSLDEMSFVETLYGHLDGVTAIDALSRERAITAGGRDTSLRLWKIAEESQLIYNGDSGSIDVIKLINEEMFVSGGDNGQLSLWGVNKKKPLYTVKHAHGSDALNDQPLWISALAAHVNTDLIASGSCDGYIRLWKIDGSKTIKPLFIIPLHGYVNSLCFTNDGSRLIAGVGSEHRLGRWNVVKGAKSCINVINVIRNGD